MLSDGIPMIYYLGLGGLAEYITCQLGLGGLYITGDLVDWQRCLYPIVLQCVHISAYKAWRRLDNTGLTVKTITNVTSRSVYQRAGDVLRVCVCPHVFLSYSLEQVRVFVSACVSVSFSLCVRVLYLRMTVTGQV